jgi:hypothetical protein
LVRGRRPLWRPHFMSWVTFWARTSRDGACSWERIVVLIVYYVIFMIVGDISAYLIGLIVEREFGSQASLVVFLALYFLFLWFSWSRSASRGA